MDTKMPVVLSNGVHHSGRPASSYSFRPSPGNAELWFQRLVEKGMPTWQQFIEEVYARFEGVDPGATLGEFNTLQQGTNTVEQYLDRFEELKSHARRSKNLCYNCDEIFRPGHKCKQQFMYCILTEGEAAMGIEEEEELMKEQAEEDMMISVNALSGNTDFYTFRLKGEAYGHEVQILIDGGNTHCFLDEEAASKLNYHLEQTSPMVVSVADGDR
ncbi:UNVERIFIED_CONTAM: hypothetical protein Slati_4490800 [Sesamum latifolium]|uniref:Retrotransposon gag domain-containing protein n=1 Tax=Sesamum latifolium TaxID=2727402 RepID=A0AAW2SUL1_9LAMI